MKSINLLKKFESVKGHWYPHQIAVVDDMQVLLAKVKGDFVWHEHEEEDEYFQVIKGTLIIEFEDREERLEEGEVLVVPKGTKHRPRTLNGQEVQLLLFEKLTTRHTGNTSSSLTQSSYPKI